MPWRSGIGYIPTNDAKAGSSTGPSTIVPPMGFGLSRTANGMPFAAAAFIDSAIVDTRVYGRAPTSCTSYMSTSMSRSIAAVGSRTSPYREYTGRPVFASVPEAIGCPAGASPRSPCSNANSAVSRKRESPASRSILLRPLESMPATFVMSPIRFPRAQSGGFATN